MDAPADSDARPWSFDELVREGGSLIPAFAPQWTNHNPSDPGITLLELLAYFSEILAYRALRITPDAKLHFLRLLEGAAPPANQEAFSSDSLVGAPATVIEAAIHARVQALSQAQCAVTPIDFEQIAMDAAASHPRGRPNLGAKCVPGVDLRRALNVHHPVVVDSPADVSVVLALEPDLPADAADNLCRHVQETLAPRCLLTTRAYVIRAHHLHVQVACRISPNPGVALPAAIEAVDVALRRRFDTVQSDGPSADAQPLGRPLHMAAVAAAIDRTPEVDYVDNISIQRISIDGAIDDEEWLLGIRIGVVARIGHNTRLGGLASVTMRRLQTDRAGEAELVLVRDWELVHVRLARDAVHGADDDPAPRSGRRRHG